MKLKEMFYDRLPRPLKPLAKRSYQQIINYGEVPDEELHSEFVEQIFDETQEYERYVTEFERSSGASLRDEAVAEYQKMTGNESMGGVALGTARDYYGLTRKLEPNAVVETGVCNGVSTLAVLLALKKNDSGHLYSIDYPFRADESLEEFQQETFENYGGAAIPSDKEPGWIIPEELRSRWELIIGKSQRELPHLMTELEALDLFVHDSEHSHPCMMFEYELAYEWLNSGGILLSDDITWNNAFSVFTDVRGPEHGHISNGVGYIIKPEAGE